MKLFIVAIVLAFLGLGIVAVDHAIAADGSGSTVASVASSAQLHDPTVDPIAALGDVRGLAARWPLLVLAVGIMLAKVIHFAGDRLGVVGKWLAVGHRAMIIAAVAGVLSALYDSLASGGTLATALLAAGFAAVALLNPKAATA